MSDTRLFELIWEKLALSACHLSFFCRGVGAAGPGGLRALIDGPVDRLSQEIVVLLAGLAGRFGHDVGDAMLSDKCKAVVRSSDHVTPPWFGPPVLGDG